MARKKQVPVAVRICGFTPCTEIIYRCPKCSTSFQNLGNRILFCYHCGTPIEWNNVPTHLSDSITHLRDTYGSNMSAEDYEAVVIKGINKKLHPES